MRSICCCPFIAILVSLLYFCSANNVSTPAFNYLKDINQKVHIFYYLWYGNPETDGEYKHWNHEILPHWEKRVNDMFPTVGQRFTPPSDLHSPYYPLLGPYSSRDPAILRYHCQQLLDININILVVSWWGQASKGAASADTQGVNTDLSLAQLFTVADGFAGRIQIAIHLEPYPGRTITSIREDIIYLIDTYAKKHPLSFYRQPTAEQPTSAMQPSAATSDIQLQQRGRPVFYIYDSYHISWQDWSRLFTPEGDLTLRGGSSATYDGFFYGLWLHEHHGRDLLKGGFDGIYTYFAQEGFSYGSTAKHWAQHLVRFCQTEQLACSISIGPGYVDSGIRPWNAHTRQARGGGKFYRQRFELALAAYQQAAAEPDQEKAEVSNMMQVISITSFNEWGEGTQIEPAQRMVSELTGRVYEEYTAAGNNAGSSNSKRMKGQDGAVMKKEDDPYLYLNITKEYIARIYEHPSKKQEEDSSSSSSSRSVMSNEL